MIKNELQYKITRSLANNFEATLVEVERRGKTGELTGLALKMFRESNESLLWEMLGQLNEYDDLKKGIFDFDSLEKLVKVPESLIKARIALNWTQRELAEHVGTTEQQIQKYEDTDYSSASFARIVNIIHILMIHARKREEEEEKEKAARRKRPSARVHRPSVKGKGRKKS